ncbi:MAG: hypothetical protein ACLTCQ_07665 [Enterocloster bolteae]
MRKRTRIIQDKRRRTRCAQLAADAFDEKLISVREEDGRTEIIMEGDAVTDMCGSTPVYSGAGYRGYLFGEFKNQSLFL